MTESPTSSPAPRQPPQRTGLLGLPAVVRGCLFDMDGVLTQTATVHEAAWKQMFDEVLTAWSKDHGTPFAPFTHADYDRYVDGRVREDGTRTFLAARGIVLPEGDPADPPTTLSVNGLSSRKNALVLQHIADDGVATFDDAVRYVRAVRDAGLRRAVVSASANTAQVLEAAGLTELFEVRIDGVVAHDRHLAGKPAPDMFLAAAAALGLQPGQAAVFEDALAGVAAGRAGGFGLVVGVDRVGQADELRGHGADVVVTDLMSLTSGRTPSTSTPTDVEAR